MTAGDQADPSVAMDDDGNYVVSWAHHNPYDGADRVLARRYDRNGVARGSAVGTTGAQAARAPSVDVNDSGAFAMVWEQYDPATGAYTGWGQRYFSDASENGPLISLLAAGTSNPARPLDPEVALNNDGKMAVLYARESGGLHAETQFFSPFGAPVATVAETAPARLPGAIDARPDGGFVAATERGTLPTTESSSPATPPTAPRRTPPPSRSTAPPAHGPSSRPTRTSSSWSGARPTA